VSAALEAVAALTCAAGGGEAELWWSAAAAAAGGVGAAAIGASPLERRALGMTWQAQSLDVFHHHHHQSSSEPGLQGLLRGGDVRRTQAGHIWAPQTGAGAEEETMTPEDVAAMDPIAGLIQMDVSAERGCVVVVVGLGPSMTGEINCGQGEFPFSMQHKIYWSVKRVNACCKGWLSACCAVSPCNSPVRLLLWLARHLRSVTAWAEPYITDLELI
jgi:hypothetical protein